MTTGNSGPPDLLSDADGHPNVVAWRLGQVEHGVRELGLKIDMIAQNYPTQGTLQLLIDPIKTSILELQVKNKEEELSKNNASAQLKLAIFVAAISPVFTIVLTLFLTGAFSS